MGAQRRHKHKSAVVSGPVEIPDAEHELVIERVAAIDVAKAAGKVCVRAARKDAVDGSAGCGMWRPRTGAVSELAEQLIESGIEKVTVESTSDYWRIWYYLLEAAGLSVQLVNARDVKNVPGRPKSDKLDAVWLAKLTEKGLLRPSLRAARPPIRRLRDYTRLRVGSDPRTHPLLAAAGEAARGRADQNLVGGLDAGHAVGAGHDRGPDRRGARPAPAGRAGPRADEGQALGADHRARRAFR